MRIVLVRSTFNSPAVNHPVDAVPPLSLGYCYAHLKEIGFDPVVWDEEVGPGSPGPFDPGRAGLRDTGEPILAIYWAERFFSLGGMKHLEPFRRRWRNVHMMVTGDVVNGSVAPFLSESSPFDAAILGEPEAVIREVVEAVGDGDPAETDHPNLCSARTLRASEGDTGCSRARVEPLDGLPRQRHELFPPSRYHNVYPLRARRAVRWAFVESSRGCGSACRFCSPISNRANFARYRTRTPDRVAAECIDLQRMGRTAVSFEDANIGQDREHVLDLCEALVRRGLRIPWLAQTRPDQIDDEVARALGRAGCGMLKMGVESASESIIRGTLKYNGPEVWRDVVARAVRRLHEHGVPCSTMIVFGLPGETRREARETVRLLLDVRPSLVHVHRYMPYTGSRLGDESALEKKLNHYAFGAEDLPNHSAMEDDELRGLPFRMYMRYFSSPLCLARHLKSFGRYYMSNLPMILRSARTLAARALGLSGETGSDGVA